MDEFVRKAAGMGLPIIILLIAMASTGLAGAAAITAALAMLGPGGMVGGIVLLGIAGLAADMLSKFGLEALLKAIYSQRLKNGDSKQGLCGEIDRLPISGDLKRCLKEALEAEAKAEAEKARLEAEAVAEAEKARLEADRQQQQEWWGGEVATLAAELLSATGRTEYEGQRYRIMLNGTTLTVEAKDGRGVLVTRQGDQLSVSDQITEADRNYFREQDL